MKKYFSIVKTAWIFENLTTEIIATYSTEKEAKDFFNSYHKGCIYKLCMEYSNCNLEWKEDYKVYVYCNEGCISLSLLCANEDESAKEKIISAIQRIGEVGTTETEKYVEIYADVKYNKMELAQMVYFEDTATLSAYFLDKYNEGHFIDWFELSEEKQNEIANLSIWD